MALPDTSLDEILTRGIVRIAATWDNSWEQYLHPSDGTPAGMVGLVGQQLATDLSVEAEFVHSAWVEQLPNLVEGIVDVCLKHTNVPARAGRVRFVSTPLLSYQGVIFVRDDQDNMALEELSRSKSAKFAVTAGSLHKEIAERELPSWEPVETESAGESFALLTTSRVDAVITDDIVTNPNGTHPLRDTDGNLVVISRDASYPSVRHEDESWFRWLENWMRFTRTQGTIDRLIDRSRADHSKVAERL